LRACLEPSEMPSKEGNCRLRACGTRFVSHKVTALEKIVARFGAYLVHLTAMTEDSSMQPADRQNEGVGYEMADFPDIAWLCTFSRHPMALI